MIQLDDNVFWDTSKTLAEQTIEAQTFAKEMICEDCKISAEKNNGGFDGDPSNRFRQIFEKDGFRLTVNTYFNAGFEVRAGENGIKYKLEQL